MEHLIEVKNLHTEFKQSKGILKAVNGVSYYLDPGEIVAFVGESGSGKSVTQYSGVQLIASPPGRITEGEILFEGQNLLSYGSNSEELRKVRGGKIGIVFQEPMTSLNPVMTIGNQLTESVMLHLHMTKAQARERAVELLKKVGIPDPESRLNAYPHQFSGGMRQRIVIAMALSCNPKLLIADEATTALDVTTQAQILDLMQDIVRESNTAMVLVTHNLGIVARYAQRVYVMYAGEIVEHGTTEEIFKNPHHPYTIGLMNAVPGLNDQKDRKLIPITGFVTNLVNRKDECAFMNRCPYATKECASCTTPQLKAVPGEEDHFAACHRTVTKETKVEKVFDVADRTYVAKDYGKMAETDKILKVEDLKVYFPVYKGLMRKKIADVKAVDGITFDIYKGGLDPAYRERVPHEFSGGQRQRLVIARAISTNPSFIVCDEAISALDVSIQAQVINLLEELQQKLGLTYLFIAHDLSVVRHISDRVAVMYLGQMVEFAAWDSLYSNPLHPYTKSLLEAVPVPDPFTEKTRERQIVQGEVPSPMQRPAGCAFSTRCPHATDRCRTQMPVLKERTDGHKVACHMI